MSIYPWQQAMWQHVIKQHMQNHLPHALLLLGSAGLGKVAFAQQLAQAILCQQQQDMPCGQCRDCHLFAAGTHLDYYTVTPELGSALIKIDQIRMLIEKLNQSAQRDGYQVALIHPANCMNRASSNALLKTLEEPLGAVVILLVADQLGSIPATITSRCQVMQFANPPVAQVLPWLKQALKSSDDEAHRLLQWASGAPLVAREMGENHYCEIRDEVLQILQSVLQEPTALVSCAERLVKHNVVLILKIIFSIALDILRMQVVGFAACQTHQDVAPKLQRMQQQIYLWQLAAWLPQLLHTQQQLQQVTGLNSQLLIEGVLGGWQQLGVKTC